MKNIHLLPTDKPSRLSKQLDNPLVLYNQFIENRKFGRWSINQNICITSDEEIKEGEYGLSKLNEIIKFHSGYDYKYYAKIILTTDQDLIKDGVQAIDDDFLEWFVKNPSCEEVETKLIEEIPSGFTFGMFGNDEPPTELVYKIIIPKEEPKQETLEETYNKIYKSIDFTEFDFASFAISAKWQAKRSYSEGDMAESFMACWKANIPEGFECKLSFNEWFEQFKNK